MTSGKWLDFESRRIWAVLLAVMALGLVAGGYGVFRVSAQRIHLNKYNELAAIATLKSGEIVQWRQARLNDAHVNASSPIFRKAMAAWLKDSGSPGLQDDLRERLRIVVETYGYDNALLLDLDGRLLLSAKDDHVAMNAAIAQAIAEKQTVLSELFRCPEGHTHIDAVGPVLDADNQPVAFVVLRSDAAQFLYPLIQSWPIPSRSAETLLVKKDGDDILFLNELRFQTGTALSLRHPVTRSDLPAVQAVAGKQGMYEGKDYRGIEVLANLRLVPGSNWFMVAKVDVSEILAEVKYLSLASATFMVLFILLVAGMVAFLFQRHQLIARKREEALLRASELRYRRLFETAQDGILILDADTGAVVDVNPFLIKLLVFSRENILGKKIWDLGFFKDVIASQDNFLELQQEEYIRYEDLPLETADGRRIAVEFVSNVYLVDSIKVVQCNIRDITDRKRAEQDYQMLFREMLDGFALHEIVCDETGRPVDYRFLAVNPAFERMTGLRAEGLVGRTVLEVMPGTEQHWIETYGKVALTGEPASFESYAAPLEKHFEVRAFRPAPRQFVTVFGDITDRRRAESLLVEQIDELQRWQNATVGRENRVLELKHEVNELLGKAGQPPRYPSAESLDKKEK